MNRSWISVLMAGILAIGSWAIPSWATEDALLIPKASHAPMIDGKIGAKEWSDALSLVLNKENMVLVSGNDSLLSHSAFEEARIQFMWDESALYLAVEVFDSSKPNILCSYDGSMNAGDGMQLYYSQDFEGSFNSGQAGSMFWDFVPQTVQDDNVVPPVFMGAGIFEHHIFGMSSIHELPMLTKIASDVTDSGYTMEIELQWTAFEKETFPSFKSGWVNPKAEVGSELHMGMTIMDRDSHANQFLYWFGNGASWGSNVNLGTFKLSGNQAGDKDGFGFGHDFNEDGSAQTSDERVIAAGLLLFSALLGFMEKRRIRM